MSQGGNDNKQALKIRAKTIGEQFNNGSKKIKSLYSFACIYKVPEDLRKLNECAYVPRLIAIGPLHRKGKHVRKRMQDVKMDYANRLFLRLTEGIADPEIRDEKKDELIQKCVEKMKNCTVNAKKHYAEDLKLNDDEMMEMMLVDGCFILQLLYVDYHTNHCQEWMAAAADPILDNILSANIVKQDLILLENQIPYFVLEELFKLIVAMIPDENKLSLEDYVLSYFLEVENCGSETKTSSCFPKDCVLWVSGQSKEIERETKLSKVDKRKVYHHILHLLQDRYSLGDLEENFKRKDSTKFSEFKVSAADLHNAGVEFLSSSRVCVKHTKGIRRRFSGIQFHIPSLLIHERTEVFLRNLIALEHSCPEIPRKVTSYVKVMSMLINSEKDVQVLKDAGIIYNYLGTDKDVPDLFDKLCKGVTVEGDLYLDACQQAIKYYNGRYCLPMTVRYWRRLIFTSTWGVLAFALGIITSVITVAQFVRDFRK